ncbi:MAG: cbb3-type cytochrome c oxidase subunit II [Sandaracinaceae bacterium]
MKRVIELAVVSSLILAFATLLLVVAPYTQLAAVEPEPNSRPYTAQEARGREHYVSLGCVYCHSQQPRDPSFGPDGQRGWGRPSTAADYQRDYPHQLGTMRTGPDLFNIGARQPSQDWHLVHLYQPRAVVAESIMPAFPFLFDVKDAAGQGDVVVALPADAQPDRGVVVAKPEALDLVAYLIALDHTYESAWLETAEEAPQ